MLAPSRKKINLFSLYQILAWLSATNGTKDQIQNEHKGHWIGHIHIFHSRLDLACNGGSFAFLQ